MAACRAGLKLEAALEAFGVDVRGVVALDSGLSTGGFADCLLQRGAARVYGVDVGFGQASADCLFCNERYNATGQSQPSSVLHLFW